MPENTSSEITHNIKTILTAMGRYKYVGHEVRYPEINMSMQFDAIFEGPANENNLILLEMKDKIDFGVYNRFRQFNLLLSKIESRRSLSFILITNELKPEILSRFQELGRTILISIHADSATLVNTLNPLLPIDLPTEKKSFPSAEKLLKNKCAKMSAINLDDYIKAAKIDAISVGKLINKQIDSILNSNGPIL